MLSGSVTTPAYVDSDVSEADDPPDVKNLRLATLGAACALGLVACFFVGVVLMVSSGVQVLIPEAGDAEAAVAGHHHVAQVVIEVQGADGVAAAGGERDQLAASARHVDRVRGGIVGHAAGRGARSCPLPM